MLTLQSLDIVETIHGVSFLEYDDYRAEEDSYEDDYVGDYWIGRVVAAGDFGCSQAWRFDEAVLTEMVA